MSDDFYHKADRKHLNRSILENSSVLKNAGLGHVRVVIEEKPSEEFL